MTESKLVVVRRDLAGVARVMRRMKAESASFPDLVLAFDVVERCLEACVGELVALQVEVRDQGDLLTDHEVTLELVGKRVADLETQTGLPALKGDAKDFEG